jgi:hypothetical protein
MALSDRPIRGGSLDPVVIAGYIDSNGDLVDATDTITITEEWRVNTIAETVVDDSDKTFTVPAGQEWQVLWIWVVLTSTATVGNRQVTIRVMTSGGTIIASLKAGSVQAASLTRNYLFAPSLADLTSFRDTSFLMTPMMPTMFLSAGQQLRVLDSGAIAAAADDMLVYIQYAYRSV